MSKIWVGKAPLDAANLLAGFSVSAGGAGAIVSFTGIVRADAKTQSLTLTHFPDFTEAQIAEILDTATKRWDLQGALVYHRVGEMQIGETIVFVATASAHRRAAFEACDFIMDYLKSEAPFWKQETDDGGVRWIEPRRADINDKKRWA
ncbi:molybdenum cofactor biosynthesis protein MoaE [Litorimonas sp. RW-G-Af-16]|uniref:molybdenum cofactor biosynthesis protein MoaE n=1 Tax=Litorimonas sp. RW-G-Af-16 TaxID=3241168 RepID=UPI00390CBA07